MLTASLAPDSVTPCLKGARYMVTENDIQCSSLASRRAPLTYLYILHIHIPTHTGMQTHTHEHMHTYEHMHTQMHTMKLKSYDHVLLNFSPYRDI